MDDDSNYQVHAISGILIEEDLKVCNAPGTIWAELGGPAHLWSYLEILGKTKTDFCSGFHEVYFNNGRETRMEFFS